MSAHKSIDKICIFIVAITLVIAFVFCNGQALGIQTTAHAIGYENRIFDRSRVHTLDIVMNDWDGFIETCESEEYSPCNLVIDGEAVKNAGIRAKGNTSLSSVRSMNSSRYSFKIEFDQYDSTKSYHGLDKLCLNNIIQDNTYMKDYLAYTMMEDFGVDAPLCSYVYITVNGEDWGLYLAVESIEDSFLQRNYGSNPGELYKPDRMNFGAGRGNGKDFSMGAFMNENSDGESGSEQSESAGKRGGMPDFGGNMPDFGGEMPDFGNMPDFGEGMPDFGGEMPEGFDFGDFDPSEMFGGDGEMPDFGGFGGMGSDDVKLKYIDDDPDSYSSIFDSAKTDITTADQNRLIRSLKTLSEGSDIAAAVDTDEVIRYFVVHNFLCNGDSYTGMMIHNYYLYEEDGRLSMIPWDYNLAYGSFQGNSASNSVNAAIDTPVSGDMSDRPMVAWIFDSEEYTEQYHELFRAFLSSRDIASDARSTADMIREYVEKDPTKFCTSEEFEKGVEAIALFCELRTESIQGQLDGTIPSTSDGQKADKSTLIDTGSLNISDMGSMGMGGGKGGFGGNGGFGRKGEKGEKGEGRPDKNGSESDALFSFDRTFNAARTYSIERTSNMQPPQGQTPPDFSGEMPEGFEGQMPPGGFGGQMPPEGFDGRTPPEGFEGQMPPGGFGGQTPPEGFDGQTPPEGFDGQTPPEGFDGQIPPEGFDGQTPDEDDSEPAVTEQTAAAPDTDSNPDDTAKNSRPPKGEFPGMGEPVQQNTAVPFILIGVSALFLLIGIAFAAKFRR